MSKVVILLMMCVLQGCFCANCQLDFSKNYVVFDVNTLNESRWQLSKLHTTNQLLNELSNHHATVHFVVDKNGKITLNTSMGCNTMSIPVVMKHHYMVVDKIRLVNDTKIYCVDRHEIELAYFKFMMDIYKYQIKDGQLTLINHQDEQMMFLGGLP